MFPKQKQSNGAIVFGLMLFMVVLTEAHREHKVHNIVLYPDKHSWCRTTTIKQVISYPGCKSEEIDNNVCVGACFSYSIPHTEPSDPGEVIVPYCDSCQPSTTTWSDVTLECDNDSPDTPPQLVKRVQIITNCSCSSCDRHHHPHEAGASTAAGSVNLGDIPVNDAPDLLDVLQLRNESNTTVSTEHSEHVKTLMNNKIVALLQSIQEKNSQYDKTQLKELLRLLHGPSDASLSDNVYTDFVESLNSEHIELDVPKLTEILVKFEQSQLLHEKREMSAPKSDSDNFTNSTVIGDDGVSGEVEGMNEQQHPHHHHKQKHHHHSHHRSNHVGNDVNGASVLDVVVERHDPLATASVISPILEHEMPEQHQHHHHHHAGESFGHGHLVKGPRGALVIEPDHQQPNVHEQLDVNPHELKLNHAGTMVSYGISEKPTEN